MKNLIEDVRWAADKLTLEWHDMDSHIGRKRLIDELVWRVELLVKAGWEKEPHERFNS